MEEIRIEDIKTLDSSQEKRFWELNLVPTGEIGRSSDRGELMADGVPVGKQAGKRDMDLFVEAVWKGNAGCYGDLKTKVRERAYGAEIETIGELESAP